MGRLMDILRPNRLNRPNVFKPNTENSSLTEADKYRDVKLQVSVSQAKNEACQNDCCRKMLLLYTKKECKWCQTLWDNLYTHRLVIEKDYVILATENRNEAQYSPYLGRGMWKDKGDLPFVVAIDPKNDDITGFINGKETATSIEKFLYENRPSCVDDSCSDGSCKPADECEDDSCKPAVVEDECKDDSCVVPDEQSENCDDGSCAEDGVSEGCVQLKQGWNIISLPVSGKYARYKTVKTLLNSLKSVFEVSSMPVPNLTTGVTDCRNCKPSIGNAYLVYVKKDYKWCLE